MDKIMLSSRYEALQEVLRTTRRARGLSQDEVAQLLHEPQSFVSKYETGVRRLDLVELEVVADALGLGLTALVADYVRAAS